MSTHRAESNDLRIEVEVALATALRHVRSRYGARNCSMSAQAETDLVARLLHLIDNESSCVVRTDLIGYNRPKFGVEVPWPAPLPLQHQGSDDRLQLAMDLGDVAKPDLFAERYGEKRSKALFG